MLIQTYFSVQDCSYCTVFGVLVLAWDSFQFTTNLILLTQSLTALPLLLIYGHDQLNYRSVSIVVFCIGIKNFMTSNAFFQ